MTLIAHKYQFILQSCFFFLMKFLKTHTHLQRHDLINFFSLLEENFLYNNYSESYQPSAIFIPIGTLIYRLPSTISYIKNTTTIFDHALIDILVCLESRPRQSRNLLIIIWTGTLCKNIINILSPAILFVTPIHPDCHPTSCQYLFLFMFISMIYF